MKRDLTQEKVKRLLHYCPDTGVFTWRISRGNGFGPGDMAGGKTDRGYISISVGNTPYLAHRLAWLYYYGVFPKNGLDHINRNPLDNRICNLREVSQTCNLRNSMVRRDNCSGIKGVHYDKAKHRWRVQIRANNKKYHVGYYKNFSNAVCARLMAEQCLDWEGCESSSSSYKYVRGIINNFKKEPP